MAKIKNIPLKAQPSKATKAKSKPVTPAKAVKPKKIVASTVSPSKQSQPRRPSTQRVAAATKHEPTVKKAAASASVPAKTAASSKLKGASQLNSATPANTGSKMLARTKEPAKEAEKPGAKIGSAPPKAKQPNKASQSVRLANANVANSPQKASPVVATEAPAAIVTQASAEKKPVNQRHGFRCNEFIVYPAHGVGRIVGIEEQEIAGMSLELFVITFEKDKMTVRVPTSKLDSVGMRKLADENVVKKATETLKGRARIKRTMWSRRAQEYEAKINSGDLVSIAEVVRDLYRSEAQPEQSYSERQLYEAALDRMARELAVVDKLDERGAIQYITEVLSKSAKGRRGANDTTEAIDKVEKDSVEAA